MQITFIFDTSHSTTALDCSILHTASTFLLVTAIQWSACSFASTINKELYKYFFFTNTHTPTDAHFFTLTPSQPVISGCRGTACSLTDRPSPPFSEFVCAEWPLVASVRSFHGASQSDHPVALLCFRSQSGLSSCPGRCSRLRSNSKKKKKVKSQLTESR